MLGPIDRPEFNSCPKASLLSLVRSLSEPGLDSDLVGLQTELLFGFQSKKIAVLRVALAAFQLDGATLVRFSGEESEFNK